MVSLTAQQVQFYQNLCVNSDREIGVDMFFNDTGCHDAFMLLLGTTMSVPTWGTGSVFAHTHPVGRSGRMPPSSVDYNRALWDYFAGVEWQMVFESDAVWAYRPNRALVEIMEMQDPDIRSHITRRPQKMIYRGGSVTYMSNTFDAISDNLLNNIAIDNAKLSADELSTEDYITNVGQCIDNNKRGFDVIFARTPTDLVLPCTTTSKICRPDDCWSKWDDSKSMVERTKATLTYSWVRG